VGAAALSEQADAAGSGRRGAIQTGRTGDDRVWRMLVARMAAGSREQRLLIEKQRV
jgi:hypothetical protein